MDFRLGDQVKILATFDNRYHAGRISNISKDGNITISTRFGRVMTTDQNRVRWL